jgi:hypothetical protein
LNGFILNQDEQAGMPVLLGVCPTSENRRRLFHNFADTGFLLAKITEKKENLREKAKERLIFSVIIKNQQRKGYRHGN